MGKMSGNIKYSKIELKHIYIYIIFLKLVFAINQHIILFSFSLNYKIIPMNY